MQILSYGEDPRNFHEWCSRGVVAELIALISSEGGWSAEDAALLLFCDDCIPSLGVSIADSRYYGAVG
jgi:hypothetical protein